LHQRTITIEITTGEEILLMLTWELFGARPHKCGVLIIYYFINSRTWFVLSLYTPSWCWYRRPEIKTGSIDWAQLSRLYLKTVTDCIFRNVVFWKINRTVFLDKDRTMDNVQKHNIFTLILYIMRCYCQAQAPRRRTTSCRLSPLLTRAPALPRSVQMYARGYYVNCTCVCSVKKWGYKCTPRERGLCSIKRTGFHLL
jgi:hypothetical protein